MIPKNTNIDFINDFEFTEPSSHTFKFEIEQNKIYGFTDKLEAMKQAIYLMLNVERYQYIIHSWNYGIELADLFGKGTNYVIVELERRIRDALLRDSRITSLEDFEFDRSRNKVFCKFKAITIYGEIEAEKVVNI
jgi:hypothetical protein